MNEARPSYVQRARDYLTSLQARLRAGDVVRASDVDEMASMLRTAAREASNAEAMITPDNIWTEREEVLAALVKIASLVEHDSEVHRLASEAASSLVAFTARRVRLRYGVYKDHVVDVIGEDADTVTVRVVHEIAFPRDWVETVEGGR